MNTRDRWVAFQEEARSSGVSIVLDEPLARHTTYRIGGPADLFATVSDSNQLAHLVSLAAQHMVPTFILGGGSNILVSDRGIRGLVIANQSKTIRPIQPSPDDETGTVVAESGVPLAGLARRMIRDGWSGLEWAVTIPGTVGGAIIGNAGAFGGEIAGHLIWARLALADGSIADRNATDLAFAYRSSQLKHAAAKSETIAAVTMAAFSVRRGDTAQMSALAETHLNKRRASQPTEPSAGSIFRNPVGDHAGRLIETCGLKGKQIGGAMVSPRHANFIVNAGSAKASHVAELIGTIQEQVRQLHGVELEPEILFVGDW